MRPPRTLPFRARGLLSSALLLLLSSSLLGGLGGCTGQTTLTVRVRTDLAPGIEFTSIEVEVEGERQVASAGTADDFLSSEDGVEVADFDRLDLKRARTVSVRLFDGNGRTVVSRQLSFDQTGPRTVVVVMSRDCAGATCGGGRTCFGGRCVDPECVTGAEAACPAAECESTATCPSMAACARPYCGSSVCLYGPGGGESCDEGNYCRAESGCTPFEGPADAGTPDVDAGMTSLGRVQLIAPWNGVATGSIRASGALATHPLRPLFRWRAVAGASQYQIQADPGCDLGDFRNCELPAEPALDDTTAADSYRPPDSLPASMSQPVGTRFFWRVRACNGSRCGAWSEVRYLDVGRLTDDFNGDGFSDLAVGAHRQTSGGVPGGVVFIYNGGSVAISGSPTLTLRNPVAQAGAQFGGAVAALGDVNGDGYADLAVGAPMADNPEVDEGNVYVYLGSNLGLATTPAFTLDSPVAETGGGGQFGGALGFAGDLDSDGYADLVVGAPMASGQRGQAFVFSGGRSGLTTTPQARLTNPGGSGGGSGRFGSAIAGVGDLDGDGITDLAIGAPRQNAGATQEGNVFVYYGRTTGISSLGTTLENPDNQAGGDFGAAVAGGDINNDGYADLVVGAAAQDAPANNEGNVFIYVGSASRLDDGPSLMLDNPEDTPIGRFGSGISVSDINGDGYADLSIAARAQSNPETAEGNVFVYYGRETLVAAGPSVSLDNPRDEEASEFGRSINATCDFDGDGYADLAIGAYNVTGVNPGEGMAFVFHGSASGLSDSADTSLNNPESISGGSFGISIARLWLPALLPALLPAG